MKEIAVRYSKRIENLRSKLSSEKIDAMYIVHLPNIRYVTGFTGSNAQLIVTQRDAYFFSDGRYGEQARQEVTNAKIYITSTRSITEEIVHRKILKGIKRLGFEKDHILYSHYMLASKSFAPVNMKGVSQFVERWRMIKSSDEIHALRKAAEISDVVFYHLLTRIKPGVTEIDLSSEITFAHKSLGASGDAFEPIVLAGKRSSLVHGQPDGTKIKQGDIVLLDFGCVFGGYHSDMTRVVVVGKTSCRIRNMYDLILEAQQAAIESARVGADVRGIDRAARSIIRKAGLGKYFSHSTGHGIGLEIHETPRVSFKGEHVVEPGNVITIEPGVYIPNVGGIRIEDDIVIGADAPEVLNKSPKELIVL